MQSRSPFLLHPQPDDSPTVRLPRVSPGSVARPNPLGTVTFVIALLGAVFAVLPSMAALGLFLCFFAVVPAIIAWLRSRNGKAMGHMQASAAVVIAPVFLIVAAAVVGATGPHQARSPVPTAEGTVTVADTGSATKQASSASPSSASVAIAPASSAPAEVAEDAAPAPVTAPEADPAPQRVVAAPAVAKPHAPAPKPVSAPRVVAPPEVVPAPKPASEPAAPPASACDEATHYVNAGGNCVPDPVAAPSAPAGATARCKDGSYSLSLHRQGTCSGHRGVATWL